MASVIIPKWRTKPPGPTGPAPTGSSPAILTDVNDQAQAVQRNDVRPSGVIAIPFGSVNLNAATTQQMYRFIAGASGATAQLGITLPTPGSLVGFGLSATALTAGSALFTWYLNGVATAASLTWSQGARLFQGFAQGTYPYTTMDVGDIRVTTTSNFSPTSNDIEVIAYLTFDPA